MDLMKLAVQSLIAGAILHAAVLAIAAMTWFFSLPPATEPVAEHHWDYYQQLTGGAE